MKARLLLAALCVLLLSAATASAQQPDRTYALERGRVELTVGIGAHQIASEGLDEYGVKTDYTPGGDVALALGGGVGITTHFSSQFGFSLTRYKNDMYWQVAEPHDPYLATANLMNFLAGIRWDFRNPRGRVRPYIGGGVVAAHFAGVSRGPSQFCVGNACELMAPELFPGTKVTGYFDMGLNFYTKGRWGVGGGLRVFNMPGAGLAPPRLSVTPPTEISNFWHDELYVSLLLRLR